MPRFVPKSLNLMPVLLALTPAIWAETMEFTPDRDNTLYEELKGDVSNGVGSYLFMGRTGGDAGSSVRRSLLRFDLTGISPNATIQSAEIAIEINRVPFQSPTGGTATLHRVLVDWGEGGSNAAGPEGQGAGAEAGDATWLHSMYDADFWSTPGGDFLMEASAASGYGTDVETLTFSSTESLVRDVRNWVTHPGQNFGWLLIGNEALDYTARRLDSKDRVGGSPVVLTVDYLVAGPTDDLELQLVASGLVDPVVITNAGDGSNRLFIVEQRGLIRIYDLAADALLPAPFLDISGLVDDSGSEQGLLGLAFHPDYENNGRFYVNYTYDPPGANADRTRIAMYQASVGDPNIASTAETVILEYEQDFANHNGGDMHFDPDGFLVIASGDGGDANDPNNRGQSLDTLLGKLLRIDVDGTRAPEGSLGLCGLVQNYGIPPSNPYAGTDEGCDEILHYGLRNPWRFSFDARTGELYIGDVGQGLWEEISYAPAGATDLNYGWKICEGAHIRGDDTQLCQFGTLPIIEYSSSGTGNCSVTGGYVYRGGIGPLQGRYLYADYCSARIWIATRDGDTWTPEEWVETPALTLITTFGQDEHCELYVASFGSDSVYRIVSSEFLDQSGFESLRCQ